MDAKEMAERLRKRMPSWNVVDAKNMSDAAALLEQQAAGLEALRASSASVQADQRAENDRLRAERDAAVVGALHAMRLFARDNPRHDYKGAAQDPCGAHAWLERFDAARAGGGNAAPLAPPDTTQKEG